MKYERDEAYVLATRELGEADLIVTLLTSEHGKVRGVARSARRSRRRFGGLLEPMTRVSASWSEKQGRELHRLDALEGIRSYARMQSEPSLQAACAVVAEVADLFGHPGQAEPRVFRLIGAVLDALEGGTDPAAVLRYYEFWTLRLHGLEPDLEACSRCGGALAADPAARVVPHAGLHCAGCIREVGAAGPGWSVTDHELLRGFEHRPPADLRSEARFAAGRAIECLLRGTLESYAERPLRTYAHLRAMSRTGRE